MSCQHWNCAQQWISNCNVNNEPLFSASPSSFFLNLRETRMPSFGTVPRRPVITYANLLRHWVPPAFDCSHRSSGCLCMDPSRNCKNDLQLIIIEALPDAVKTRGWIITHMVSRSTSEWMAKYTASNYFLIISVYGYATLENDTLSNLGIVYSSIKFWYWWDAFVSQKQLHPMHIKKNATCECDHCRDVLPPACPDSDIKSPYFIIDTLK